MWLDNLPEEVHSVLSTYQICEFTTLTRNGDPITWPAVPLYRREEGRILITTSIGLPLKVYHVRHNSHVSALFSDSTGTELCDSPAVLVQGDACSPERIVISPDEIKDYWIMLAQRQPDSASYSSNFIMRKLMDWYYMRLLIFVKLRVVTWWPGGDFGQPAHILEETHVVQD